VTRLSHGAARHGGPVPIAAFAAADGRAAVARVRTSCVEELAAGPPVAAVRPTDLLRVAPWPALLERNTPGHQATQVPVLIDQGGNDERVAPASNRSLAALLCRAGDRVQLRTYPNVDHEELLDAAGDDLLAGRPAGSTCQS
jgi:pimeloyl-ACP methyl ester carboxylesterase